MKKFNLAIIQMNVTDSKPENMKKAEEMLRRSAADGADAAVLPEMFISPYSNEYWPKFAEAADGPSVKRLSQLASELGIVLVAGTIPEVDEEGRLYNSSFCFSADGKLIGRHRKIHLFDINIKDGIKFKESDTLSAGEKATIIETPWGKIGIAICFDIRFAELFRFMAMQGAHTIIVPAAFNMTTGPAHWELAFRSRAVDNQVYMAGCAPARSKEASYTSWGNSLAVDPWGRVTDKLDAGEGIIMQKIDPDYVESIRAQLPILSGVKPEGYTL